MFFIKRLYCTVNPLKTKGFFHSVIVCNTFLSRRFAGKYKPNSLAVSKLSISHFRQSFLSSKYFISIDITSHLNEQFYCLYFHNEAFHQFSFYHKQHLSLLYRTHILCYEKHPIAHTGIQRCKGLHLPNVLNLRKTTPSYLLKHCYLSNEK